MGFGPPFLFSHKFVLMRYLIILLFLTHLISCQTDNGSATEKEVIEVKEPITYQDYCYLFLETLDSSSNLDTISIDKVFLDATKTTSKTYQDTVKLPNGFMTRLFVFEKKHLIYAKLSSYIDSTFLEVIQTDIEALDNHLDSSLGQNSSSTKSSTQWSTQSFSINLKFYESEGIDLVFSGNSSFPGTECVGDFIKVQEKLKEWLASSKLTDEGSLVIDGFNISQSEEKYEIQYDCQVSKKLILLDEQSIIYLISNLLNSKPSIIDNQTVWTSGNQKIIYHQLSDGHQVLKDKNTD